MQSDRHLGEQRRGALSGKPMLDLMETHPGASETIAEVPVADVRFSAQNNSDLRRIIPSLRVQQGCLDLLG
jgi:hypothetical protein